jgi:hypothetical protein
MKSIDDRLDAGDKRCEALEKNASQREDLLRSIERKVDRLTGGSARWKRGRRDSLNLPVEGPQMNAALLLPSMSQIE